MKSLGPLAAVVSFLSVAGCSPVQPHETQPGGGGQADGGGGSGEGGHASTGGGGTGGAGEAGSTASGGSVVAGTVGMVVIDVQQTFVDGAVDPDLTGILDRTKSAFQLATDSQIPFFLTFEGSEQGDHALYAPLQPVLPPQTKDFVKTTFDATGQPAFSAAVQQAGLSHLVVLGSETDVCVLQTVLGLRSLGFTVLLERDGVFTSETNISPALRRMQQAGALLVDQAAVASYVANPGALPKGPDAPVVITSPLHLGVVLNDFTAGAVSASPDPWKTQKAARLRELLLVSEWFDLPVYVADVGAGLPAQFAPYYEGQLRPLSQIAQDGFVTQLVVAGTDGGLAGAMPGWQSSHQLFVMEDALLSLGTPAAQKDMLKPFFDQGLVPTTYKSFYYDMTKSVNVAEWPSQQWIQKYDEYYQITQAPEDLPPIPSN